MEPADDLDAYLKITLRRDEAIVLQAFLARELMRSEPGRLHALCAHPAEELSLEGLLHELIPHLTETGGPGGDALYEAAVKHLIARFQ